MDKPINVTKPALPDLEDFIPYLKEIWATKNLTNNGPFHQRLEKELCSYFGINHISLFSNGTIALVTALQSQKIKGEVITTPFSFAATTHALWWNNIKPVFVDIEPETFTLDTKKIEAAITPQTTAILPVHVYGYPCKIDEINEIAKRYNLKVIYDAAHTFGAQYNGCSVAAYGDMSILSFHATKVFNTFEGGAIVCHDAKTKEHIDYLKNFGFADEFTIVAPGINGKMNEFQAALGLTQLDHIEFFLKQRKEVFERYVAGLKNKEGLVLPPFVENFKNNYAYFPILINEQKYGKNRDEVYDFLKSKNIYARKYFYPLISNFPTYKGLSSSSAENLPVANEISNKILCLPIYPDLREEEQAKIIHLLLK